MYLCTSTKVPLRLGLLQLSTKSTSDHWPATSSPERSGLYLRLYAYTSKRTLWFSQIPVSRPFSYMNRPILSHEEDYRMQIFHDANHVLFNIIYIYYLVQRPSGDPSQLSLTMHRILRAALCLNRPPNISWATFGSTWFRIRESSLLLGTSRNPRSKGSGLWKKCSSMGLLIHHGWEPATVEVDSSNGLSQERQSLPGVGSFWVSLYLSRSACPARVKQWTSALRYLHRRMRLLKVRDARRINSRSWDSSDSTFKHDRKNDRWSVEESSKWRSEEPSADMVISSFLFSSHSFSYLTIPASSLSNTSTF